jgi:hypothetical protein
MLLSDQFKEELRKKAAAKTANSISAKPIAELRRMATTAQTVVPPATAHATKKPLEVKPLEVKPLEVKPLQVKPAAFKASIKPAVAPTESMQDELKRRLQQRQAAMSGKAVEHAPTAEQIERIPDKIAHEIKTCEHELRAQLLQTVEVQAKNDEPAQRAIVEYLTQPDSEIIQRSIGAIDRYATSVAQLSDECTTHFQQIGKAETLAAIKTNWPRMASLCPEYAQIGPDMVSIFSKTLDLVRAIDDVSSDTLINGHTELLEQLTIIQELIQKWMDNVCTILKHVAASNENVHGSSATLEHECTNLRTLRVSLAAELARGYQLLHELQADPLCIDFLKQPYSLAYTKYVCIRDFVVRWYDRFGLLRGVAEGLITTQIAMTMSDNSLYETLTSWGVRGEWLRNLTFAGRAATVSQPNTYHRAAEDAHTAEGQQTLIDERYARALERECRLRPHLDRCQPQPSASVDPTPPQSIPEPTSTAAEEAGWLPFILQTMRGFFVSSFQVALPVALSYLTTAAPSIASFRMSDWAISKTADILTWLAVRIGVRYTVKGMEYMTALFERAMVNGISRCYQAYRRWGKTFAIELKQTHLVKHVRHSEGAQLLMNATKPDPNNSALALR